MSGIAELRRLGRTMQIVLLIGAFPIPLALMWVLARLVKDPFAFEGLMREVVGLAGPMTFSPGAAAATVAMIVVQIALLVAALYCVWRMFGAFAGEEPLALEAAIWMKRASVAFLVMALGGIVIRALIVVVLTLGNPPGQQSVAIGIGSSELLTLLIASIMYMLGRVMAVAAEVRADQRGFV